jgi:LysM repeat protein
MILRRLVLPLVLGLLAPFLLVSAVSAAVKHTVSGGDTLSLIAQIYEKSVAELAEHNGILNPDVIFPGQEIEIPGEGGGAGGREGAYTVQPGDTLSGIAAQHGVTTSVLQSANGISDADYIYVGQVLTVPSAYAAPPSVPKLSFPARPVDADLEAMIDEIAYMEGVEPGLVKAIATVESGWSQWAISHAGAIGIMQVMPGTVWWLETEVFGFDFNEYDSAWDNVRLGARYLRILLEETGGDDYSAVSAYYQGLTPTQAGVYYPDTEDYASMVLAVRAAYW